MTARAVRRPLALLGLVALGTTTAVLSAPGAASADVDDFDYSSWEARYEVSLDDEGRAFMHVEETLVAAFPEFDQNRGIVYGLTTEYRGTGTDTQVLSVTDENGDPVDYWTEDDGLLYVLTGNDDYVHGETTYVIEYTMRDVMLAAEDTGGDEFYWDLLPLDSSQDIESFHAEISFAPELAAHLTGDAACYQGVQGSTDLCELAGPVDADGSAVFSVSSGHRAAGDGVTVAIGFESGTVTQPPGRLPNPVLDIAPWAVGGGSVAAAIGGWIALGAFRRRRRTATGIIVAQFDVPASVPPLLAAPLVSGTRAPVPAEIVHLAVRGDLRIEDTGDRPALRRMPGTTPGDPLDEQALSKLFGKSSGLIELPEADTKFANRMRKLEKRGVAEAAARGYTTQERSRGAVAFQWVSIALFLGAAVLANVASFQDRPAAPFAWIVVAAAGLLMLISCFFSFGTHTVHTRAGAELNEHLLGVKEFIRVAEADRLQMLQSYTGAERRSDGSVDVIHIYEKLLPYAVLFGQERQWADVLDVAYSTYGTAPTWYDGYSAHRLGARMVAFSHTAQRSAHYSPPSSSGGGSSGFSGSSGGGFSGGGGGGGFSGGR